MNENNNGFEGFTEKLMDVNNGSTEEKVNDFKQDQTSYSYSQENVTVMKDENEVLEEEMMKAYIGEKAPEIMNEKVNATAGVLGFFFGPVWFFYRKCTLVGFGLIALHVLVAWLCGKIGFSGSTNLIMTALYLFAGNAIYLWDVRRKVKGIREKNPSLSKEELIIKAQQKGGVSVLAIVLYTIFYIIYTIILIILIAIGSFAIMSGLIDENGDVNQEKFDEFMKGLEENQEGEASNQIELEDGTTYDVLLDEPKS